MLYSFDIPPGPHFYCGPSAIAAVTGTDPRDVLYAAHRFMDRGFDRPIVGMSDHELTCVLGYLGFRSILWHCDKPHTFRQFVIHTRHWPATKIVRTARHYMASAGDVMLDNNTCGKPVHFELAPHPLQRVLRYWIVSKL